MPFIETFESCEVLFFFCIFLGGKQLLTNSSTLVRLYYRCVLCPCCYFSVQPLCAFGVVKVYQYIVSDQQKLIRWLLSNINSGVTEFSWKSGLIDHVCSGWSDNTSTIHKSYSYSWVAFGSNEHFNSGLPSNYSSQPNAGRPLGKMNSRSGDLQAETTCMAACSISFFPWGSFRRWHEIVHSRSRATFFRHSAESSSLPVA